MNENQTEIESNIDGVEVTIKGPTDKASEIFGRLSQANKSTVESIHDAISKPEVLDLISSVDDKDTLIEKAMPLVEKFDPRIGSLLSVFKLFRKKKKKEEVPSLVLPEFETQPSFPSIKMQSDIDLLKLLDFKGHRFWEQFGKTGALIPAPITVTNVTFKEGSLHFSPNNKKSEFKNYAFDENFEIILQESSSHDTSTKLWNKVKESGKKAKYVLVVDIGHRESREVLGRSLVTEV